MLICLIIEMISQFSCISKHLEYLKHTQLLLVNHTSIQVGENKMMYVKAFVNYKVEKGEVSIIVTYIINSIW